MGPIAGLEGGNSRPHRDSIPDGPARSQSLYRLGYRAHMLYVHCPFSKYKANLVWIFYTLLFLRVIFILKVNYVFAPTFSDVA